MSLIFLRRQPYTTYAVMLTTLSPPAFITEGLLFLLCLKATANWNAESQRTALGALLGWMLLSKCVKLLGHYLRYPIDFLLLPISIMFGYFHGFIKVYAMWTLNVVSSDRRGCVAASVFGRSYRVFGRDLGLGGVASFNRVLPLHLQFDSIRSLASPTKDPDLRSAQLSSAQPCLLPNPFSFSVHILLFFRLSNPSNLEMTGTDKHLGRQPGAVAKAPTPTTVNACVSSPNRNARLSSRLAIVRRPAVTRLSTRRAPSCHARPALIAKHATT